MDTTVPETARKDRAQTCLDLLRRVAEATNRPDTPREALGTVLETTCDTLGWAVGHVHLRSGEFLVPSDVWCLPRRYWAFRSATLERKIRVGEGLVGRAAEGRPIRIEDVSRDSSFLRRESAEGLRTGFAFPILAGEEVVGVMTFLSDSVEASETTIEATMESIGVLLGRVVERERAERRVAAIARVSDDVLWEYDAVRDHGWRGEGYRELFGDEAAKVLTLGDFQDRVHPADRDRAVAGFAAAVEELAETWSEEYRIRTSEGETVWVFDRGTLEYDPEGRWLRATGAMMDITDRKRTEERLRRRTHDLGERVKELACLYDVSRILLDREDEPLDSVLERVVERLPAGWQHPPITSARIRCRDTEWATRGFRETPWIQSRAFGVGDRRGTIEVAYLEDPRESEEEPVFLEEEERLIDAIADRLSESVRRIAMEERIRKSESYYRTLVENASDLVTILDEDGTILYESPSVERILGYDPADRVGDNAFEFVHPDDVDGLRRTLLSSFRDGLRTGEARFRIRHADGSWRHLEATGVNLLADRDVGGIVATTRDITDRVRLEEQLLQSQKMEAVGRLAGGVAHDFNNALTVIRGYAQVLGNEPGLAPWSEEIDEILHSTDRASALTQQLLAFGRRNVNQPEAVAVDRIVGGMERMLRRLIGERVDLVTDLAAARAVVSIDPGHLEQLLMNLVVNARDAMPDGGTVTISTTAVDAGEDGVPLPSVRLEVRDEGVGMDDETLAHLFEPFFTTREDGTGLGLSIVYGVVDRAGGRIEVDSAPGEGSAFRVHLPRVEPGVGTVEGEEEDEEPVGADVGVRILLVEDEEAVRRLARAMLESVGHEVATAPDVETALARVDEEGPFDLVVTDVVLPGRSGFDLAEILRASRPDLPMLFVSGYPEDDRASAMHETDRVRFLQKPFDRDVLLSEVDGLLAGD